MQENVTVNQSAIKNWQMHPILVCTVNVCMQQVLDIQCDIQVLYSSMPKKILGPQHSAVAGGHLTVSLSPGFPAFFAGNGKKRRQMSTKILDKLLQI
jgi:hypothetical protein